MDLSGIGYQVHHGDVREGLGKIAESSVHCIVSSPPYWGGIRDYGIPASEWADGWTGCYGSEPTVQQYIAHTLEVFDAMGRVLRDDGCIFWNLGDTYADETKWGGSTGGKHAKEMHGKSSVGKVRTKTVGSKGNKSLVPHRVAIALQDHGWVIRQDIVWRKGAEVELSDELDAGGSPMPESIGAWRWERCRVKVAKSPGRSVDRYGPDGNVDGDVGSRGGAIYEPCPGCPKCESTNGYVLRKGAWRPSTGHEYIFMVTKPGRYFCDADAVLDLATGGAPGNKDAGKYKGMDHSTSMGRRQHGRRQHGKDTGAMSLAVERRNPRSVWSIVSEPFPGLHFAAFPTELAWKCIQAGTSKAGCCPSCGAQWAPVMESERVPTRPGEDSKVTGDAKTDGNRDPQRHVAVKRCNGYRPTCECDAGDPVPPTVCDPFTGSGTSLQVAINTGRRFVGCEIADHYLPIIKKRAATPWRPKAERALNRGKKQVESLEGQQSLFG